MLDDIDNVLPQRLGQYPKLSDIEPPLADFYFAHETLRTPESLSQFNLREASFLSQFAQQGQQRPIVRGVDRLSHPNSWLSRSGITQVGIGPSNSSYGLSVRAPRVIAATALLGLVGFAIAPAAFAAPSPHTSKAGTQYLADAAPVNKALNAFIADAGKWTKSTPSSVAGAEAKPSEKALGTLDHQLLVQTWPSKAKAAIRSLYNADTSLLGDLAGLGSVNILTGSQWGITFDKDATTVGAAANVVRHDLGLPAAK